MARTTVDTTIRNSIRADLDNVEKVCMRWAVTESNAIEPPEMARMLADFYTGVEGVCIRIIEATGGSINRDEEGWAGDLLEHLTVEVDGKRPALITPSLKRHFTQFMNLRDMVREEPGFAPSADVLKALLCSMEATLTQFRSAVLRFLERMA